MKSSIRNAVLSGAAIAAGATGTSTYIAVQPIDGGDTTFHETFDERTGRIEKDTVIDPFIYKNNIVTRWLYPYQVYAVPVALPPGSEARDAWKGDSTVFVVGVGSEGYTLAQKEQFFIDGGKFVTSFLAKPAYAKHKQQFEFVLAFVPSPQSGIKHPNTAPDCSQANPLVPVMNPVTWYNVTMDYGNLHRLTFMASAGRDQLRSDLNTLVPGYRVGMLLCNTPYYGGGGGEFAVFTANANSAEIGIHEFGHAAFGLGDEYGGLACTSPAAPALWWNCAPDTASARRMFGAVHPPPYFLSANYSNSCWWRCDARCCMQALNYNFCGQCVRRIDAVFASLVPDPFVFNVQPASQTIPLGACVTLTASGATTYKWNTGATSASISVCPIVNTVYSCVGTKGTATKIASSLLNVLQPDPLTVSIAPAAYTLTAGQVVTLTATGADTYTWQPGALSGAAVTVAPTATTTYTVTGHRGTQGGTASAVVTVNPVGTSCDFTAYVSNATASVVTIRTTCMGGAKTFKTRRRDVTPASPTVSAGNGIWYDLFKATTCAQYINFGITAGRKYEFEYTCNECPSKVQVLKYPQ